VIVTAGETYVPAVVTVRGDPTWLPPLKQFDVVASPSGPQMLHVIVPLNVEIPVTVRLALSVTPAIVPDAGMVVGLEMLGVVTMVDAHSPKVPSE
jgi:hypothetical protein